MPLGARGEQRAQETDPQREVLDQDPRSGDALAQEAAGQCLASRQRHHGEEQDAHGGALDARDDALGRCTRAGLAQNGRLAAVGLHG